MAKKQNKERKYSYKYIQFTVSNDLRKNIEEWTEKSIFTTISDFIRNAVEEKIRRLKNPELFQSKSNSQINPAIFNQMLKQSEKSNILQEKVLERMRIFDEMRKDLYQIRRFSIKEDLIQETKTIINLLKAHKTLSQKQIIEKTNLDKETVFQIVSTDDRIKLNMNGRFELNE